MALGRGDDRAVKNEKKQFHGPNKSVLGTSRSRHSDRTFFVLVFHPGPQTFLFNTSQLGADCGQLTTSQAAGFGMMERRDDDI